MSGCTSASSDALPAMWIISTVADYYGISVSNLCLGNRERRYSEPRHIAAYCLRTFLHMRLMGIASLLGGKTHRTIIYAVDKVDDWVRAPYLNEKAVECVKYVANNMI